MGCSSEKVKRWTSATGQSEATFWRVLKRYHDEGFAATWRASGSASDPVDLLPGPANILAHALQLPPDGWGKPKSIGRRADSPFLLTPLRSAPNIEREAGPGNTPFPVLSLTLGAAQ